MGQIESFNQRPQARLTTREQMAAAAEGPSRDLFDLIQIVRRRLGVLLFTFVLITGAATAVVVTLTPAYTATASVMIETSSNPSLDVEAFVTGLPVGREEIQTEVAVLESRQFAERVVSELELHEDPEFNTRIAPDSAWEQVSNRVASLIWGSQRANVDSVEEQFDEERSKILQSYSNKITVLPRDGTTVIDISATSTHPSTAAELANTIADLYVVEQLEAKFEATKLANDWLTSRVATLRADLEAAEAKVEAYRSQAGLLQGGGNTTLAAEEINAINQQLTGARIRQSEVETRLARSQALLNSASGARTAGDVLNSTVIQGLLGQETDLVRRMQAQSASVGANHPSMVAMRVELDNIRGKIGIEISKVVDGLRNEAALARAQVTVLEQSLREAETRVSGLNAKEGELRILEREAEASRNLYETLLARFKQSEDQESIQRPDARIISRAEVPLTPSFPNKPIIVSLAGVMSILMGLLLIALLEQFDRGVHSMEEVHKYFGLPCLGLVPQVTSFQLAGKRPESYVVWKPTSAFAEAVRSVRTSVQLADTDLKPRIVAVTSSRPNEGKTSIAISMARLNALGGRRTIVVDLDLRKPELYDRLNAPKNVGVIDYLSDQASLEEVIQKDAQTGLEYIVAGKKTGAFAELLRSGQLDRLVKDLGGDYDLIVFDAPPVLAVGDTRIIARAAEKVMFVARWSDTPRDVARLALRQLADSGVDIAGVVISLVDVQRNSKFGYGDSESFTGAFQRYYTS